MNASIWCVRMPCMLGWFEKHGCCRWNSGETCKSRPSEPVSPRRDNQGFAQTPFTREVAQATRSRFWASRQLAQARGVSPKRDLALLMPLILCPRLDGGGTRLSESVSPERGAGRDSVVFGCLLVPEWFVLVEYDCMMSDMYIMEREVYLAWFMNCKWWVGMRIGMWIKWDG